MQEDRGAGYKVAPFLKLQPLPLDPIISCFDAGILGLGGRWVKVGLIFLGMEVIPHGRWGATNIHVAFCGHFQLPRYRDEEREGCEADVELD